MTSAGNIEVTSDVQSIDISQTDGKQSYSSQLAFNKLKFKLARVKVS